jgi:hypothetical protein
VIAIVRDGLLTETDPALLPLFLKRTGDVEGWLIGRAIDSHRTNSRLLKKALRLSAANDAELVLRVNAATVTDTYWFRECSVSLSWEDARFKANYFDKLALRGDPDSFNLPYSPTPELTNIGSFEKCWRLENDKWWMIKQGNELERFSELFICGLGKALGFPMAEYLPENGTIKSPDFTCGASVNYESAEGIVGDNEDYGQNFEGLLALSPALAEQYLQIIYLDTICFNMDRHTKNYGVLRDVESGKILSMAPNFDNNISLFARGIPKNMSRSNDMLISLFCEFIGQNEDALVIAKLLPSPTWDMAARCAAQINMPINAGDACTFIMNGSNQVQEHIRLIS